MTPELLPDPTEVFWLSGLHACSDLEMEAAALAVLDAAAALARAGSYRSARLLCARVIFHMQPLIAARPPLLLATLYTLLVAHGFKLISHVISAVSGRRVEVILLPDGLEQIRPPRRHDKPYGTVLVVDPRWLDLLAPDDVFLQHWCDGLRNGPPAATLPLSLSLEPPDPARTVN